LDLAATYNYRYYGGPYSPRYEDLLAGGMLAFVYGLAAGIFSLKRKMFAHCLTGGAATVAEGFLLVLAFAQQWDSSWAVGVMFGVPIILLSSVGLFFISLSKNEYR
jgi:LytS/YehU family sensor histidine kinase